MATFPRNMGQETGGDDLSRVSESRGLLKLIQPTVGTPRFEQVVTVWELGFVIDMLNKSADTTFKCSGKQLFRLRDIKDKLVERGLI